MVFGWRTTILVVLNIQLLLAAGYLLLRTVDPRADRLLAALILVVIGILTPHMIGFAGFYDAFPWLSFAPFANEFLIGPLIAGYLYALTSGALGRIFWLSLIPAILVFCYELYWFAQPLEVRWEWAGGFHADWFVPVISTLETLSTIIGFSLALWFAWRYRAWLFRSISTSAEYDLRGIGLVLLAAALGIAAAVMLELVQFAFGPLSYMGEYPYYLALGFAVQALAIAAILQPGNPFPKMRAAGALDATATAADEAEPDWVAIGQELAMEIKEKAWFEEPRLSLSQVAQRLRLSEAIISRAINLGLGTNFNQLINTYRIDVVKKALVESDDDVLAIALDAGFNSKATFNRVFKEIVRETPRQYRNRLRRG